MQINSINLYSQNNYQNKTFKAVYPTNYFVREVGDKFKPASMNETVETLQRKTISLLNISRTALKKGKTRITDPATIEKKLAESKIIQDSVAQYDTHYRNCMISRSFYDENGGLQGTTITPMSYIITGRDVDVFGYNYGKPIGEAKKGFKKGTSVKTAEQTDASARYNNGGLNWVKENSKNFSYNGEPVSANFFYEAIRNKNGEVKEYKPVGVRYYTESKLKAVLEQMKKD